MAALIGATAALIGARAALIGATAALSWAMAALTWAMVALTWAMAAPMRAKAAPIGANAALCSGMTPFRWGDIADHSGGAPVSPGPGRSASGKPHDPSGKEGFFVLGDPCLERGAARPSRGVS